MQGISSKRANKRKNRKISTKTKKKNNSIIDKTGVKKILRPLSQKEKILLLLLFTLSVYFLTNKYIYLPQGEKIDKLKAEKLKHEEMITENNRIIKNEKFIIEKEKKLSEERDIILSNYFPVIDQSQIIYLLDELLLEKKVDISSFSFSKPSIIKLNDREMGKMDIQAPIEGEFDDIIHVLEAIEKSPRKILFNSLSFSRSEESDNLNGKINLNVLSLEGIVDADGEVIYVESVDLDRDNPFKIYENYSRPIVEDSNNDLKKERVNYPYKGGTYDFKNLHNMEGNVELLLDKDINSFILKSNYLARESEDLRKGYIDLSQEKIIVKEAGVSIAVDILTKGNNNYRKIGFYFQDINGDFIDIALDSGANINTWTHKEAILPDNKKLYPLTLEGIFITVDGTKEVSEEVQFSSIYLKTNYVLYKVMPGDTIYGISIKYYGSPKYMNDILNINNIRPKDILPIGKTLKLKMHDELIYK